MRARANAETSQCRGTFRTQTDRRRANSVLPNLGRRLAASSLQGIGRICNPSPFGYLQRIVIDRPQILDAIKRLAESNDGRPPGRQTFERETGIRMHEWYPLLWLRWSDALREAGYIANRLQTAIPEEVLIQKFIEFTRELGRVPLDGEFRQRARNDKSFPSHGVWSRFGGKSGLLDAVRRYCEGHTECKDVCSMLADRVSTMRRANEAKTKGAVPTGYVYLMKSGRHYKIGKTNAVGRRERELAIQIPVPPKTIHWIETDDPTGVETYWQRRFSDKRGTGEWFELSPDDVAAFKRWKRIV